MAEDAPIHASCVAIGGKAVLICGPSGAGKSDLALRLLDRGAQLVSDDYCIIERINGQLYATAPARIAGYIEVRGLGIVPQPHIPTAPVALVVQLDPTPPRLPPDNARISIAGHDVPVIQVDPHTASAPIKVEWALRMINTPKANGEKATLCP